MTLRELLVCSRERLSVGNIDESAMESEVLLKHALGISRVDLYAGLVNEASPEQEQAFWKLVQRRLSGEPTAYITGHREFYGLDFRVDRRVLIPRPETELLVEQAIKMGRKYSEPVIADIGTGSGCIAISLALNLPHAIVYATDVSAPALEVARINCEKHGVGQSVHLLEGDLLAPLPEPVDLIVANLPYVPAGELAVANDLRFEPSLALDGGPDGEDKIRQLCGQVDGKLRPGGYLLLEVGDLQANSIVVWLQELFPSAIITLTQDLNGIDRLISLSISARATCEPISHGVRETL